jgi:hypothetical protein
VTDTRTPPTEPGAALLRAGRFFRPGTPAPDLHSIRVNCTGSCRWKVYVKDGIITWETQATDYPSVGPDRPEYEPRGCPRGAAFWEAKERLKDAVPAWAEIQGDPGRRRARTHHQGIRTRSHRGLLPHPRDVDGLPCGGRPLPLADRRADAVVLRLVCRPSGGLPAGRIPPLSPVVDVLSETGHDGEDAGNLFGAIDTLRIPLEYLAELFTAGEEAGGGRGDVPAAGDRQVRGPVRHPDRGDGRRPATGGVGSAASTTRAGPAWAVTAPSGRTRAADGCRW